ncbi:hypothetical protein HUA74_22625 [Myxococcus sp. CA051A]|uniref:hypothetical protein n=1 Tax=Myxococcus sp. CA051A TaxID=2741739 RepID=UPI00157B96D1|nr:hypothetical protein [Myxococcus sp. CA051A]NTX63452.1 hypothetical protein [Myxococcus sp. CA051A]
MAEHEVTHPRKEPRLPEDGREARRSAGEPVSPPPDQVGGVPDTRPGPGKPVVHPSPVSED